MTLAAGLRRALPATLLVYGCETAAAALIGAPFAARLANALAGDPVASPRQAAGLLEAALLRTPAENGWALAYAVGYALLGPFLALTWLGCMHEHAGLSRALRAASASYRAALALAGACVLAQAAALVLGAVALQYLPGLLPESAAAQTAVRSVLVAAIAIALLALPTVHDLACAALAAGAAGPRAALSLARRGLGFDALGWHGLAAAGSCICLLGAELAGRALERHGSLMAVFAAQQLLAFLALCMRAAWLAFTVERTGNERVNAGDSPQRLAG